MDRIKKLLLISFLIIILDQLTKWIVFSFMGESLLIRKVRNTGAAFGIMKDTTFLLAIFAVIAVALIIYYHKKFEENFIPYLGLIVGGAIGNLIDRLLLGYVRDFISISIWPVFNIADSAISIGAAVIVFLSLREDYIKNIREKKNKRSTL